MAALTFLSLTHLSGSIFFFFFFPLLPKRKPRPRTDGRRVVEKMTFAELSEGSRWINTYERLLGLSRPELGLPNLLWWLPEPILMKMRWEEKREAALPSSLSLWCSVPCFRSSRGSREENSRNDTQKFFRGSITHIRTNTWMGEPLKKFFRTDLVIKSSVRSFVLRDHLFSVLFLRKGLNGSTMQCMCVCVDRESRKTHMRHSLVCIFSFIPARTYQWLGTFFSCFDPERGHIFPYTLPVEEGKKRHARAASTEKRRPELEMNRIWNMCEKSIRTYMPQFWCMYSRSTLLACRLPI